MAVGRMIQKTRDLHSIAIRSCNLIQHRTSSTCLHHAVSEVLGSDAASRSTRTPTFRKKLVPSHAGVENVLVDSNGRIRLRHDEVRYTRGKNSSTTSLRKPQNSQLTITTFMTDWLISLTNSLLIQSSDFYVRHTSLDRFAESVWTTILQFNRFHSFVCRLTIIVILILRQNTTLLTYNNVLK
jgi:hypothetical protein